MLLPAASRLALYGECWVVTDAGAQSGITVFKDLSSFVINNLWSNNWKLNILLPTTFHPIVQLPLMTKIIMLVVTKCQFCNSITLLHLLAGNKNLSPASPSPF